MSVVLVGDDHDGVRNLVRQFLAPEHTVLEARNGAEVLTSLREQTVDVVVLDLDMPILSGLEICAWIRRNEHLRGVGIIILTGSQMNLSATELGAQVLLHKPSGVRRVRAAVDFMVNGPTVDANESDTTTQASPIRE